jgi:AcrR family transcriptional regulator
MPDGVGLMERPRGSATRFMIVEAAAGLFSDVGYAEATLEDIGAGMGIGRSAVLYHFGSKQELLCEVVRPFLEGVDELLDDFELANRSSARGQRRLITEFVALLCRHRRAAVVLYRDAATQRYLPDDLQSGDRMTRFVALMMGADRGPDPEIRALAALGAVIRPVVVSPELLDLETPEQQLAVCDAAMRALRAGQPRHRNRKAQSA